MNQTRNTKQKQLVRGLLEQNNLHLTADEVYEMARITHPKISRGTVYRNLNMLAESGEINRLPMPVGPDHYDFITHNHYHFICRNCYQVIDTDLPYQKQLNEEGANLPGCKTEWHRLVLVGLCSKCNK